MRTELSVRRDARMVDFEAKRNAWFEQRAKAAREHQAANTEDARRLRARYLGR